MDRHNAAFLLLALAPGCASLQQPQPISQSLVSMEGEGRREVASIRAPAGFPRTVVVLPPAPAAPAMPAVQGLNGPAPAMAPTVFAMFYPPLLVAALAIKSAGQPTTDVHLRYNAAHLAAERFAESGMTNVARRAMTHEALHQCLVDHLPPGDGSAATSPSWWVGLEVRSLEFGFDADARSKEDSMGIRVTAWLRIGDRSGPRREVEISESTPIRPAAEWLVGDLLVRDLHDACERLGGKLANDHFPGGRLQQVIHR